MAYILWMTPLLLILPPDSSAPDQHDLPDFWGNSVSAPGHDRCRWAAGLNTAMEADTTQCNRLLRLPEVANLTSLSASTIYGLIRERQFPSPIRLSRNRVAWTLASICEWLAQKQVSANTSGEGRS